MSAPGQQVVRIGIIGCGEITQVVHIPTLRFMHKWFRITALCDVSAEGLQHCAGLIAHSDKLLTTQDYKELCASSEVDAVLVATSDEFHAAQSVAALENDKFVLVEKPLALNKADIQLIADAEAKSSKKVMVGYMRRYAAPFADAIKEIGSLDKIVHARVRGIIGPNAGFISQSGTFPEKFTDFRPEDTEIKTQRGLEQTTAALAECGTNIPVHQGTIMGWRVLCGLASHDISVMREVLGLPKAVIGATLGWPYMTALFQYDGFNVIYESGMDNIPRFDAHIELYGLDKVVRIQYDSSYIKGLPVTLHVSEVTPDGAYKETKTIKSYEDPYTLEMKAFWDLVVNGIVPKTTVADAKEDLEVFGMLMRKHAEQA